MDILPHLANASFVNSGNKEGVSIVSLKELALRFAEPVLFYILHVNEEVLNGRCLIT